MHTVSATHTVSERSLRRVETSDVSSRTAGGGKDTAIAKDLMNVLLERNECLGWRRLPEVDSLFESRAFMSIIHWSCIH